MSDKKIDSLKHKKATRARIPSQEEAGYENNEPNRADLPLNPVTTRGQDPELYWMHKYGAVDDQQDLELDIRSLYRVEHIAPEKLIQRLYSLKREANHQDDLFVDELFGNYKDVDELDKPQSYYKHADRWANRLIQGDSLMVMGSLLEREAMKGKVQMIYIDPPYGIKYNSNWQMRLNDRNVKDGDDASLSGEPEVIKAFRDTWELGIHSYLSYLRDRLLVAKELLTESGSCFVQISDENLHLVRCLMDEVFGSECFIVTFPVKKKGSQKSSLIDTVNDYLLWYSKAPRESGVTKFNKLFVPRELDAETLDEFKTVELPDGRQFAVSSLPTPSNTTGNYRLNPKQIFVDYPGTKLFRPWPITNGGDRPNQMDTVIFDNQQFNPPKGRCWSFRSRLATGEIISPMERLGELGRLWASGKSLDGKRYLNDFPYKELSNWWDGLGGASNPIYVVQTNDEIIKRCILMTTDPGDLVLDPTCGSGTTAYVAEKWGRRWITCDTSRVAVTLAKQRLMTASYDYYELRYPHEGLRGGFIWKTVPHVTLKSIANNPEIDELYERMHPAVEAALATLNAALAGPSFRRKPESRNAAKELDAGLRRHDEGGLQEWEVPFDFPADWNENARAPFDAFHAARQSMQKQMDRSIADHTDLETLYDKPAKSKTKLRITGPFSVDAVPFPTVAALDETRPLQEADASIARSGESSRQHQWRDELLKTGIRGKGGQMLKFAELETQPGTRYLHATGHLESGERVVVSFGPEYAALEQRQVAMALTEAGELFPLPKMIVFCAFTFDPEAAKDIDHLKGIVALKAQMNTDLLTEDLKKARASNQSFWLMGQPDVEVRKLKNGDFEVEVHGFDYFDTVKAELVSGGKGRIAMWSLDTDYDERSLFPHQVFFPMAGKARAGTS